MKTDFNDYASRTRESSRIVSSAPDAIKNTLNDLQNIFYAFAYPLESAEFEDNNCPHRVQARIAAFAATYDARWPQDLSMIAPDADRMKVTAVALEGIFDVVATRIAASGRLIGNGHHARQEAAASAVIKLNDTFKLNI